MIIEIITGHSGKTAHCICDRCGKEITRAMSLLNTKNHFCSRDCSGNGRPEIIHNVCMVCGKPKDNTFYDKSDRPICSKEYTWERKGLPQSVARHEITLTN